ncbi:winged helix-turn-helix transcriptional regulator [Pararhodonellum marinum]|uniref:winged helix-turn-helix transcriptional regulator n=1 Tax=Pararhodonellum marinum TaxID=2755358 RepID=UPI00188F2640|nr:helix-turn-helix domain-containing protein [Pararhodonellum marinum]
MSKPSNTVVTIAENESVEEEKNLKLILDRAKDQSKLCPVRDVIHRISDKWSLLSILALGTHGTLRFNALKKEIGDVSQRMLTVTLRNLEEDGFVSRKIYAEVPPRVEYQLTDMGQGLMQQALQLADWANTQLPAIISSRKKFKKG